MPRSVATSQAHGKKLGVVYQTRNWMILVVGVFFLLFGEVRPFQQAQADVSRLEGLSV
jgi:hypothetical protein